MTEGIFASAIVLGILLLLAFIWIVQRVNDRIQLSEDKAKYLEDWLKRVSTASKVFSPPPPNVRVRRW